MESKTVMTGRTALQELFTDCDVVECIMNHLQMEMKVIAQEGMQVHALFIDEELDTFIDLIIEKNRRIRSDCLLEWCQGLLTNFLADMA